MRVFAFSSPVAYRIGHLRRTRYQSSW